MSASYCTGLMKGSDTYFVVTSSGSSMLSSRFTLATFVLLFLDFCYG